MKNEKIDVLIVGGSHAGLSAAMALGRMSRTTLIVDAGNPRNKVSEHANNIVGMDGIEPSQWRHQARDDLKKYGSVEFITGQVLKIEKQGSSFITTLSSGDTVLSRKIILAYGVKDKLPAIQGIWDLWGKSVFHCPYCHGYEVKDKSLGFVGNGYFVEHMLPMIFSLSQEVTVFTQGKSEISDEFTLKMKKNNIRLYEESITSLEKEGNELKSVILESGEKLSISGLFVGPIFPLEMNSTVGEELGCEKNDMGFIKVGMMGDSSVKGVFVAGDIMSMQQSVVGAASTGQLAGSGAVMELTSEDF